MEHSGHVIQEYGSPTDCVIITREGTRISAHKSMLFKHSEFFRVCLTTEMQEKKTNEVTLVTHTSDEIRAALQFFYCNELKLPEAVSLENMLNFFDFLGVPTAVDICAFRLVNDCGSRRAEELWALYELFKMHNLEQPLYLLKTEMQKRFDELKYLTYDNTYQVRNLIELWVESEFELYKYLTSWLSCHSEIADTESVMGDMRFPLMSMGELKSVKESSEYLSRPSNWTRRVDKAEQYCRMPLTSRKVFFYNDGQNTPRGHAQSLTMYKHEAIYDGFGGVYDEIVVFDSDLRNVKNHKHDNSNIDSKIMRRPDLLINVNGFIVAFDVPIRRSFKYGTVDTWGLFDPRTGSWHGISGPEPAQETNAAIIARNNFVGKDCFAVVQHGRDLYTLGGYSRSHEWKSASCMMELDVPTDTIERYNFETDTWCRVKEVRLPVALGYHGACSLGEYIYVGGGLTRAKLEPEDSEYDSDDSDGGYATCHNVKWYRLHVATGEWSCLGSLPQGRRGRGSYCWHKNHDLHKFNKGTIAYLTDDFDLALYDVDRREWRNMKVPFTDSLAEKPLASPKMFITDSVIYVLQTRTIHAYHYRTGMYYKKEMADNICPRYYTTLTMPFSQ